VTFVDYRDHLGARHDKPFKATLFRGEHLMLGVNCLEPGQGQPVHTHETQDKFYFVLEGEGTFTVGPDRRTCGAGVAICALAGVEHGVMNETPDRLVFLMTMAPPPA
jgi:quercetin dioxygenase-like cupin family protein